MGPRSARTRRQSGLLVCWLLALASGCAEVTTRDSFVRNALRDRVERHEAKRTPVDPLASILARDGLFELALEDPAAAATRLEARLSNRPEPGGALALAELSYRAGMSKISKAPDQAIAWLRDSAALATIALKEPESPVPDLAVQVHNRALARLVRIAQTEGKRNDLGWQKVLRRHGVVLEGASPDLAPGRFEDLLIVEDIRVSGMQHVYREAGIGVPLVVHRRVDPAGSPDPLDRFHPRELRMAATAIVSPIGDIQGGAWRRYPITLALLDPFVDQSIQLGSRELSVASDRTSPLAVQVSQGQLSTLEFTGLFDSDFRRPGVEAGLYLLRPYQPGKIPVVLVHGLFSSPRAYLQTMNELENDLEIDSRYQFWVYLYPTGQPIPASAMELRASLNKVRDALDPNHDDPSMNQMVLVGHSMGGLLSKMMVQDSGLKLWEAAFRRPVAELKASPRTRKALDDALIFDPLPFVKRVIFIATPHRGSPIADQWFGRTIASMIRRTSEQAEIAKEIVELNGPDLIAPELRRMPLNAIGNLRTDSPILQTLDKIPIDPSVPYHSIIPQIGKLLPTDGVVEYRSSHLEGSESELVFPGTHFSQKDPVVTAELTRILREHIRQF
ncbi:esterase/lipase family protein [Tundrisphaera lichenicola]|uniref:esterase/lipase family protein n=1 Tax=Tundrisphaera lichenicola TaxID=2029860 RepID=UPI003EC0EBC4